jgi:hypothetical protein
MPVSIIHSRKGPINFGPAPATVRIASGELVTIPPGGTHVLTPEQRAAENVKGEERGTFGNVLDVIKGVGAAAITGIGTGLAVGSGVSTIGGAAARFVSTVLAARSRSEQREQQAEAAAEQQRQVEQFFRQQDALFAQQQQPQGASPMFDTFDLGGLLNTGLQQLGNIVTARMTQRTQDAAMRASSVPLLTATAQPQPVAFPSLPSILGTIGGAARAILPGASAVVGTVARGVVGLVRTAGGAIRGVILSSGRFVSRGKAVALARKIGPEAAAAALGITAVELAQMIVDDATATRRRINPLNIKAARRAIRRIKSVRNVTATIERQVARALPPRRFARPSSGSRSPGRITRAEALRALRK